MLLLRHPLEPHFFKMLSSRGSSRWIDSVNLKIKSHDERGKQGFYFRIKHCNLGSKDASRNAKSILLEGQRPRVFIRKGKGGQSHGLRVGSVDAKLLKGNIKTSGILAPLTHQDSC